MSKQKRHGPQNARRTWCLGCGRVRAMRSGDGYCRECRRDQPGISHGMEAVQPPIDERSVSDGR